MVESKLKSSKDLKKFWERIQSVKVYESRQFDR